MLSNTHLIFNYEKYIDIALKKLTYLNQDPNKFWKTHTLYLVDIAKASSNI